MLIKHGIIISITITITITIIIIIIIAIIIIISSSSASINIGNIISQTSVPTPSDSMQIVPNSIV